MKARTRLNLLLNSHRAFQASYRDLVSYRGWTDTQRSSLKNELTNLRFQDFGLGSPTIKTALGTNEMSEEEKREIRALWMKVEKSLPKLIDVYCNQDKRKRWGKCCIVGNDASKE
jgi:hypothetical protein